MASIDKAAIVFSIAITAIGAGFAFAGDSMDFSSAALAPVTPNLSDVSPEPSETATQPDLFSDEANEVKEETTMVEEEPMEETTMVEEEPMEETTMVEEEPMEETTMVEEEPMEETTMVEEEPMEETTMVEESTGSQGLSVEIPVGTSSPGCEDSNACYLPADITVNAGDTVEWINVDTAAHTVTAGGPADGPSGLFDSSLVMADAAYSFTFEEAGNYDYFCMVHPWMVGSVTVN